MPAIVVVDVKVPATLGWSVTTTVVDVILEGDAPCTVECVVIRRVEVGVAEAEADVALMDDVAVVATKVGRVEERWTSVPLVVDVRLLHEDKGQCSNTLMSL